YEVQKGIENREFVIYFQPQIEIATESIVGAEVLVRWNSKDKGMISPGYFIPVLEKNGFIANLDKYIWEEVCRWQRARIDRGEQTLPVSVNVSRIDAFSLDLEKTFVALTEKYQIPRSCIKIEMTESTYAEDDYKVGKIAEDLRESGFAVYLDDFGSGYSSLNMLKNVGVDVIKIDMQFLNLDEKNAERGEKIMESVVQMTRSLGIPVIIEGAETEQQIKTVTAMGSRYVQGFYYYKPMSEADFDELLKNKNVDYRGFNI
ncbi:MAG: EAL domain-containing protein, partial [Agathobacter sp.]|nr:EAL domain-containing protein [Agathobacter sp.]